MIYPAKVKKVSNEVGINDVFDYGDKIMGCIKYKLKKSYKYVEINLITFILEQTTSKRKGSPTIRFCDIVFKLKKIIKNTVCDLKTNIYK